MEALEDWIPRGEIALAALTISFAAGWPVHWILGQYGVVDRPNRRSSHSGVVVRGGGVGILLAILSMGGYQVWKTGDAVLGVVLTAALAVAAISFLDDLSSIRPGIRIMIHFAAALAAVWFVVSPGAGSNQDGILGIGVVALGVIWLVGYTNVFNFMDGINGLASAQAIITGLGVPLVCYLGGAMDIEPATRLSLILGAAAAGFMPHNFPRARMFMGDVGSAPLGFLLAMVLVWVVSVAGPAYVVPILLLHSNFLLDAGITLLRRVARGDRWYEPHREHFYQRLIRSGRSHLFVTGLEACLLGLTLFLVVLYVRSGDGLMRMLLAIGVVAIWLTLFGWAEAIFRDVVTESDPRPAANTSQSARE